MGSPMTGVLTAALSVPSLARRLDAQAISYPKHLCGVMFLSVPGGVV